MAASLPASVAQASWPVASRTQARRPVPRRYVVALPAAGYRECAGRSTPEASEAPTMPSHEGFLRDISSNPDDDAPRLIYADWLEDNGDLDRAEFIPAQVQLARVPAEPTPPAALVRREAELLAEHGDEWRAALPRLRDVTWRDFVRGFVEQAEVAGTRPFLTRGKEL